MDTAGPAQNNLASWGNPDDGYADYGRFAGAVQARFIADAHAVVGVQKSMVQAELDLRGLWLTVIDVITSPETSPSLRSNLMTLLEKNGVGIARVANIVAVKHFKPFRVDRLAVTFKGIAADVWPLSVDSKRVLKQIAIGWAPDASAPLLLGAPTLTPEKLPGADAAKRRFFGHAIPSLPQQLSYLEEEDWSALEVSLGKIAAELGGVLSHSYGHALGTMPEFLHPNVVAAQQIEPELGAQLLRERNFWERMVQTEREYDELRWQQHLAEEKSRKANLVAERAAELELERRVEGNVETIIRSGEMFKSLPPDSADPEKLMTSIATLWDSTIYAIAQIKNTTLRDRLTATLVGMCEECGIPLFEVSDDSVRQPLSSRGIGRLLIQMSLFESAMRSQPTRGVELG